MVHLGRLRALCEVADRGTIAAAAEALHLSASAVSQQLSALERDVGERLVERHGRGVRLTPTARVLVRGSASLFAEVESLHAEVARHATGRHADLRVGAFASAIARIVAPAARELRAHAPDVHLQIVEAEGEEAFAALLRHELDVVVSIEGPGAPPAGDPRTARASLRVDPLLAVLPADHPLAPRAQIPLAALAAEPWAAPPTGWLCERVIVGGCQAAGFTPRIAHRAGDWEAIAAMCAAGLGVALVPALAGVRSSREIVVRPVEEPAPRRHIFAACRRGAEQGPAVAAVIEAMLA
jgi:DNA-binding transcriptional LysR family regulator